MAGQTECPAMVMSFLFLSCLGASVPDLALEARASASESYQDLFT